MLKAQLDAEGFQALPEPLREHYSVVDSDSETPSYRLQVLKAGNLELVDPSQLRSTVEKTRAEAEKYRDRVRSWEVFKDEEGKQRKPEDVYREHQELHEKLSSASNKVDPTEFEARRKAELDELQRKHHIEREASKAELQRIALDRDTQVLRSELAQASLDSDLGMRTEAVDHLLTILSREARIEWTEDGKPRTVLMNGEQKRLSENSGGDVTDMGIKERLAEMRSVPEFSMFFKAKEGEQVGASGRGGAGNETVAFDPANPGTSMAAFASLAQTHGVAKARELFNKQYRP